MAELLPLLWDRKPMPDSSPQLPGQGLTDGIAAAAEVPPALSAGASPAAAVADASAMIAEGVQGGSNNAATDEEKEQVLQISAHEADLIERRI